MVIEANSQLPASGQGTGPCRALVLAGGLGTRLRAVVADRPKPLASVDGEPFLARILDQLAAAGCREVVLCTGHLGDAIEHEFGREHAGMVLHYSRETAPLGTAGALRPALPFIAGDDVLVVNGDSYCDVELASFVRAARTLGGTCLLAVDVADAGRYGRVDADERGQVHAFRAKGATGPGTINAGVYWLTRTALDFLAAGTARSLESEVLPVLVAAEALFAVRTQAPFLDIGVPDDLARAAAFFADCASQRARPRQGLLVVDRDGTLIAEKHYLADPRAVELLPGVVDGLRAFAAHGFELAVVTNQSGIGRGYFDEATLAAVHHELVHRLAANGITLGGIWHCPHTPAAGCACRKPEPGLLHAAMAALGYAPEQCLVVGDKACDIDLGARLGVRTALVRTGYGIGTEHDGRCTPDAVVDDLAQLAAMELATQELAASEVLS